MRVLSIPEPRKRKYLPEEFKVTVWSKLKPYYNELQNRSINSVTELERWIYDWNEINALVTEDLNWRYIHLSIDTRKDTSQELYNYLLQRIMPKVIEVEHLLSARLLESEYQHQLNQPQFKIYLRNVQNTLELYQAENIKLLTNLSVVSKNYSRIVSQFTIPINGRNKTVQQVARGLESLDRETRAAAYHKIGDCFLKSEKEFDQLFDELVKMRTQVSLNADFKNFRDYKFKALGRFDYAPKDCYLFHESVKRQVVPVLSEWYALRKQSLKLEKLKPYDLKVAIDGSSKLEPFKSTKELVAKTIRSLSAVHPFFGECLAVLQSMKHLDLDTRKGKQPGGYNMPLLMTGVPFIFMNASNSLRDLVVLSHESGHAIHSFSTRQYQLNSIKISPSEIGEFAAMSMELLVMEHWNTIFSNPEEERIARLQHLEKILSALPWIAQVDEFQHWVYSNPEATPAARKSKWIELNLAYTSPVIDADGLEAYMGSSWQRQLHVFELPFYYIEYGMAQLGAIALWKNYRENPTETIERFRYALSLGYSRTIPEIYEAAGIAFDFSERYIQSIIGFLREELEKCYFRVG